MQNYHFSNFYSCIFMRWCIGYIWDDEAEEFLKRAKKHLYKSPLVKTRSYVPGSFIIIVDQILDEEGPPIKVRGQWIRSENKYLSIFKNAGLLVHH